MLEKILDTIDLYINSLQKDYPKALTDNLWQVIINLRKYSDGQPRDDHGRWTDGGGGDSSSSSGGMSSGRNNEQTPNTNTSKIEQVGNVDFNDKQAVLKVLSDAEKEFVDLPYEKCRTVTSDGKVWDTTGTSGTVDNSEIEKMGSSLKGSYSYHNHPKNETYFSFSGEDAGDFISKGEEMSIASDYKYLYFMQRQSNTVSADYSTVKRDFNYILQTDVYQLSINEMIDIDEDGYHQTIETLSKKYNFSYRRVAKHG